MNPKLNEAFPIVAAALGNRLGVRVMVNGPSAKTDGKTIVIPAYDGNDPGYREVAWGYLAHEAAHIRYTDFDVFKKAYTSPIRKAILNILEDVRIEQRLAVSYPGTRLTIEKTVAKLIDEGGYDIPSEGAHPAVLLQAYLLFGLRSGVLGQTLLKNMAEIAEDRLQRELPPAVFDALETLRKEVSGLDDTREALSLTDRILKLFEDTLDQESPDDSPATQPQKAKANAQGVEAGDSSDSDTEELEDQSDDGLSNSGNGSSTLASAGKYAFVKQVMEASESDLHGDLFDKVRADLELTQERCSQLTLPVADEPPLDPVRGRLLLEKALAETGKIRASLQGLVQSSRSSKPVTRRSGNRVDCNRLFRVTLRDSRVFCRMDARKAPNTAVHLLVDRSPSMSATVAHSGSGVERRIDVAWEATLSLAMALEGIQGVNIGVTAFPGRHGDHSSVYAVLPHGSSIRQCTPAFGCDLDGSTPLAEALWFAAARLLNRQEPRKILFVLTDGIPDDLAAAQDILARCRASNIEVTGIGLGLDVNRVFDRSVTVQQLPELPNRLHDLCKTLLIAT